MIKILNTPESIAKELLHLVKMYNFGSEFEKKVAMAFIKLVATKVTISTADADGLHECELIEFPGGMN